MTTHHLETSPDGLARLVPDDGGPALAWVFGGNILRDDLPPVEAWPLPRVLVWSGTLGADLFEPHPMTWLAPGHAALRTWCDARRPGLEAGGARVLFLPHARHVLNDAQSTLSFLLDRAGQPFDVVLSTDALLEPSMLDDVEDHVERMHAALGDRSVAILGGPLPGAAG